MQQTQELSYRRFVAYAALAVGVVLVPVLIWQLGWILILGFAAILVAILLHVVSEPLQRWTSLPVWADLLIAGLIVLALVALGGWIFGSQLSMEFSDVVTRVRAGAHELQDLLHESSAGQFLLSRLSSTSVSVTGLFGQVVTTFITAIEALVVIVMSAAYLAAEPALYRAGVVRLFGPTHEEWANDTIVAVAEGLRYWLLGQFIEMALIGALTTLAVWQIGLPSPLALGAIATLTEFVPYLGPILAAIPALLVAVTGGARPGDLDPPGLYPDPPGRGQPDHAADPEADGLYSAGPDASRHRGPGSVGRNPRIRVCGADHGRHLCGRPEGLCA